MSKVDNCQPELVKQWKKFPHCFSSFLSLFLLIFHFFRNISSSLREFYSGQAYSKSQRVSRSWNSQIFTHSIEKWPVSWVFLWSQHVEKMDCKRSQRSDGCACAQAVSQTHKYIQKFTYIPFLINPRHSLNRGRNFARVWREEELQTALQYMALLFSLPDPPA